MDRLNLSHEGTYTVSKDERIIYCYFNRTKASNYELLREGVQGYQGSGPNGNQSH